MKQRPRIYYSDAQKELMWDRWQKGDSMRTIAGVFINRVLSNYSSAYESSTAY